MLDYYYQTFLMNKNIYKNINTKDELEKHLKSLHIAMKKTKCYPELYNNIYFTPNMRESLYDKTNL